MTATTIHKKTTQYIKGRGVRGPSLTELIKTLEAIDRIVSLAEINTVETIVIRNTLLNAIQDQYPSIPEWVDKYCSKEGISLWDPSGWEPSYVKLIQMAAKELGL